MGLGASGVGVGVSWGVKARRPVSLARRRFFKRYAHPEFNKALCAYCGEPMELDARWVMEHKIPKARGGSDDPNNLTLACNRCNIRKGRRTPDQWREHVRWQLVTTLENAALDNGLENHPITDDIRTALLDLAERLKVAPLSFDHERHWHPEFPNLWDRRRA